MHEVTNSKTPNPLSLLKDHVFVPVGKKFLASYEHRILSTVLTWICVYSPSSVRCIKPSLVFQSKFKYCHSIKPSLVFQSKFKYCHSISSHVFQICSSLQVFDKLLYPFFILPCLLHSLLSSIDLIILIFGEEIENYWTAQYAVFSAFLWRWTSRCVPTNKYAMSQHNSACMYLILLSQPSLTSSLLGPNILLSTLCSDISIDVVP